MRRAVPLLGVVLALAFSSAAAADTFRVARPHGGVDAGTPAAAPIPFTEAQTGPMSFDALRGIWEAAGNAYGIPWEVLAAINKVETNFGSNLGPSSAGAVGWMQFMPSTWARWGLDANGDGVADPDNPTDAIFSAARYLAACGGQFDIAKAIYCYNHASWYVSEVLSLAALYSRGGGAQLTSSGPLQSELVAARDKIESSKKQLGPVLAQARKLAGAERKAAHAAATAHVLSDQLEAHRSAVLIGIRRQGADARVTRLRSRLHAATAQLGKLENETGGSSFAGEQLLSSTVYGGGYAFSPGGGFVPTGQSSGVVAIAMQYLGVPYLWGGASPSGFDCSGLVQYVFAQVGVSLPHNTVLQWNDPQAVSVGRNDLQPGDLVFFNGLDHVGIYIGGGDIIDAPHTGAFVEIDSLSDTWFAANYDGAKRIVDSSSELLPPSPVATAFAAGGDTGFSSNVVYFTR
jgi:cell wall-associated NlpC family hydrolase